jgi:hypothetical protein
MSDNLEDTLKIPGLPKYNEHEYAKIKYNEALQIMLASPTLENIEAFSKANERLYEVEDAYRIGGRLKLEYLKTHATTSHNLQRL